MALIKCNECGKEISDKATQCIHCGCPIEKKVTCSECGNEIEEKDEVCLNCGCPIEKEKEKNIVIKDSTKIWLIVCSVVCFLISIYCFIFQKIMIDEEIINSPINGIMTLVLGITYIQLWRNLSRNNYFLMLGINIVMLLYGISDLSMLGNFIMIIGVILNSVITTLIVRKNLKKEKFNFKEYIPFIVTLLLIVVISLVLHFGIKDKLVCTYSNNNSVGEIVYEMVYTFKGEDIKELRGYQYAKPSDRNVAENLWKVTNKQQDQYNYYEGLTYKATFSEGNEISIHYTIDAEKAPNMFDTISSLSGVKGIKNYMSKNEIKTIYEENGFTCK